ncbi:MAG: RagB/SusD family nutrient uptake outer membrane protein [Bacteroidota bacterium]
MKRLFLLSFFAVTLSVSVFSQDCIWKGNEDSLWQNPLNWSCSQVPDSSTDVYIFGGTQFMPVITGNVTCKNLYVIDSVVKFLDQAYGALSGDHGYGSRFSLYFTVDNDEMMINGGGMNDNGRRSLARYDASPLNGEILRPFRRLYSGIEKSNICIKYFSLMIANNLGSDTSILRTKRMYGEALTLRSQMYFELIRNWGDVPYTDSTSFFSDEYIASDTTAPFSNLQSTNRDTTYKKILNDLALAESFLPWRTELALLNDTADERITKAAAKALRARIALFAGGYSLRRDSTMQRPLNFIDFYQIAKQECAELINHREQHTLNPHYKALWKNTICAHQINDGYGEFLFQVKMDGGSPATDSKLGYYNGPRVNGLGNRHIGLLPTYFYMFDSIDTRRDVTAAPYEVLTDGVRKRGLGITLICDGKFRRDWITNPSVSPADIAQYYGLNWPLIRFSDVLLMFAEADNELSGNPTAEAISAFEEVRKRGYGADSNLIGATPLDQTSFFNAIVKERALEFGGEGIRKYDLIRWNLLETKILETRARAIDMTNHVAPFDNLPLYMYYDSTTTADNSSIWANSLYFPGPTAATGAPGSPAGATRIGWTDAGGVSGINYMLFYFAANFIANKCELFPYPADVILNNPGLIQNPGY